MPGYSVETLRQLAAGDEYYRSILVDHMLFGSLTLSQIKALEEKELEPNPQTPAPARRAVDVSKLEQAIAHAKEKGVAQPILRVAGFSFMPADPNRAQWHNRDAIFVTTKERNGVYLGKVLRGSFIASRECTPEVRASVLDALDDPLKAATEYGFATGKCSICDRTLTNPESIKLGIGPICRAKFGW